jgi:hypothetical protein
MRKLTLGNYLFAALLLAAAFQPFAVSAARADGMPDGPQPMPCSTVPSGDVVAGLIGATLETLVLCPPL